MRNGDRSPAIGGPGRSPAAVVQFALDVRSLADALPLAEMAVRAGVDWLEVGTPLILFSGIPVVGQVASAWPGRTIMADIKIVDGGRKYVVAAAQLGAHLVTVCGVATDATVREAIAGAREAGIRLAVDLYAAPDPVARAREVAALGADLVYLHYGGDAWAEDPAGDRTLALVATMRAAIDIPIGFATASLDGAVAAVEAGADIIAIGYPFLGGPGAEAGLTELVGRVHSATRA